MGAKGPIKSMCHTLKISKTRIREKEHRITTKQGPYIDNAYKQDRNDEYHETKWANKAHLIGL